jgi:hypothetical protein
LLLLHVVVAAGCKLHARQRALLHLLLLLLLCCAVICWAICCLQLVSARCSLVALAGRVVACGICPLQLL